MMVKRAMIGVVLVMMMLPTMASAEHELPGEIVFLLP